MPSLAEYRALRNEPPPQLEIVDLRHPKQAEFVRDGSRFKAALCGRRSGKSNAVAYWLSQIAMLKPGGLSVYIAGTKREARMNLMPALQRVNREFDLGCVEREQDGQLFWCFPNGHRVWLSGCADRSEIDKFRGASEGLSAAVIDEAQKMPFLDELYEFALRPALMDQKGPLIICGTPHPVAAGYFYEITTGEGDREKWPTHHWTPLDNPYLADAAGEIEDVKRRNRWDDNHPTLRREYYGEWVHDEGALVYPYNGLRNACVGLGRLTHDDPEPTAETLERAQYALVVDLGASPTEKSTAFLLGATLPEDPHIYILSCEKRAGMTPSSIAARVEWYRSQYRVLRVVIDEGGLGVGYAAEMREYHGIPCEPAEKKMKRAFQEMMSGDMRSGVIRVVVKDCRVLIDEWIVLPWNEDRTAEAEGFENHGADGALYLRRALRPLYHAERVKDPETEGQRMRREAIEAMAKKRQKEWQRSPRSVMKRAMGLK